MALLGSVVILGACTEKLDSSAGCPVLCADPGSQVQTITLDAVTLDTTVNGGLGIGTEQVLLLASRGTALDTRLIFRFDTLPSTALETSGATSTTAITSVDSVFLRLHFDSLAAKVTAPVTLSVYDVDGAPNDTLVSDLAPLFTASRLLGSVTLAPGKAVDTVSVPISKDSILSKIQNAQRLRIGVQVTSTQDVSLRQPASETAFGARLYLRTSADFKVPAVTLPPYSKVIANDYVSAAALRDFMIVVAGTAPAPSTMLAIGGVPGTRAYFKFSVPSKLVDSSIVVRATLLLTQVPSGSLDPTDTLSIQPEAVVAGTTITDPGRAAQIVSPSLLPFATFKTFPTGSGAKELEVAPAFSLWAAQKEADLPRALVLKSTNEGTSPQRAFFYSSEATDPTVRPKLRISYTPRTRIGIP